MYPRIHPVRMEAAAVVIKFLWVSVLLVHNMHVD